MGCKEKSHAQPLTANDSLIVNCYTLQPVKNDSQADTLRDFIFSEQTLDDFLAKLAPSKVLPGYDSTMDYITSFGRQKMITVNHACFSRLNKPDSSNLINIYFNSGTATWVKKKSAVQFLRSYQKNILNFGAATVFEYRFNNVAEIEPHFMYIILKKQTDDTERYGKDHKGLVLCSDGLDWKAYGNEGLFLPLFIQMVRRTKEFYVPLYYDGNRFIPIRHFKSNIWKE